MQCSGYLRHSVIVLVLFLCQIAGYAQQEVYICPGDTLRMQARALYADRYIWYRDEVQLLNETNASIAVIEPGSYTVLALNGSLCNSGLSQPVVVREKALLARYDTAYTFMNTPVDIHAADNDVSGCWGLDALAITIINPPIKGTVGLKKDGTLVYRPFADASGSDSFLYTIKDMTGHVSNSATVNITIGSECAIVYPNPARDVINVELYDKDIAWLRLTDASGQVLRKIPVLLQSMAVDISSYADGFYVLQAMGADGNVRCIYKIIKKAY